MKLLFEMKNVVRAVFSSPGGKVPKKLFNGSRREFKRFKAPREAGSVEGGPTRLEMSNRSSVALRSPIFDGRGCEIWVEMIVTSCRGQLVMEEGVVPLILVLAIARLVRLRIWPISGVMEPVTKGSP